MFCDAYRKGVYGNKFQWLIVGMYEEEWWLKSYNDSDCTPEELQQALVGVMVMDIQALASHEEITVSGRVSGYGYSLHDPYVCKTWGHALDLDKS